MPSGSLLGPKGARLIGDLLAGGSVRTVPRETRRADTPADPFLFQVAARPDGHVYVYVGPVNDETSEGVPAVIVNERRCTIGNTGDDGWNDLGEKPDGAWYVVLAIYRVGYASRNILPEWRATIALRSSIAEPGIYSDTTLWPSSATQTTETTATGLALFRASERQWRVVAYEGDDGLFRQVCFGAQSFSRHSLDTDISSGLTTTSLEPGEWGNVPRASRFLDWDGGAITLNVTSGRQTDGIPLVLHRDTSGRWRLGKAYTETITYLGADGREHEATVFATP